MGQFSRSGSMSLMSSLAFWGGGGWIECALRRFFAQRGLLANLSLSSRVIRKFTQKQSRVQGIFFTTTCRPPTTNDLYQTSIVIALERHSSDAASDLDHSTFVSTLYLPLAPCSSCCSSWGINTTSTPYLPGFHFLCLSYYINPKPSLAMKYPVESSFCPFLTNAIQTTLDALQFADLEALLLPWSLVLLS